MPQLAQDQVEMTKQFSAFRTRLLGAWLLSNGTYVSIVQHFDLLPHFAVGFSCLICGTLAMRAAGDSSFMMQRLLSAAAADVDDDDDDDDS